MTDLCLSCNLCCNGSIFSRVPVTEDERDRLPADMRFFRRDGNLRMALPCPRLGADGGCSCYAVRPGVCRTYNCRLSKRHGEGRMSGNDALEVVAEIKAAQDRARELAARAMGRDLADLAEMPLSDVFRRLKAARAEAGSQVDSYTARRARLQRGHYIDLVRLHLQPDYMKRAEAKQAEAKPPGEKQAEGGAKVTDLQAVRAN